MKVSINSDYEYGGKKHPPEESFDLTVEGEVGETPEKVAGIYLKLRRILRKGIGKEGK